MARLWALLIGLMLACAAVWEAQTSTLQSHVFARWSSALRYTIAAGPSAGMAFPDSGPFDERRGYTRIPELGEHLESRGFRVTEQARQTPALRRLIRAGIAPPYQELSRAGLVIRDRWGESLYDPARGSPMFASFADIPPRIVETLLFIENRRLGDRAGARQNPAIDWPRSMRALLLYGARRIGFDAPLEGGSTLATQIEKYRHSRGGRTSGPGDKLRQVLGASLKAYHASRDTREARERIILDYLNTMPLGAAPGIGEVQGLGEGLRAWFGMELADVRAALAQPEPSPEQAHAWRHVLALLYAVRAPTYYLVGHRRELETRVDAYARLLHTAGALDDRLLPYMQHAPLAFATRPAPPSSSRFLERKAVNALRVELAQRLKVPRLYDLDRLHVQVDSTIDGKLQDEVTRLLRQLASADFVAANGLRGPQLLAQGDPAGVTYSLLLFESRPEGNLLRVQTDTLDAPFDVNDGMKLELGSTAKLRTLAHYLELIAMLHSELATLDAPTLERRAALARDPLTRWAAATLRAQPGLDLEALLRLALERQYSASPHEVFFTGGGMHRFHNFDPADNDRVMSVREATIHSTNLVYIRLLRDVVRFHQARLPYDARSVLEHVDDPARQRLLEQIAEEEALRVLARSYHRYRNLSSQEVRTRLLGPRLHSLRHLTILFYAWHSGVAEGDDDTHTLQDWLQASVDDVPTTELRRLARAYGNPHLTLADFGYLLDRHPLEVWCAGQLAENPHLTWETLVARSMQARHVASQWLFKTRNRAAQDLRLRTRIERDAFARMTPYWHELGFAFGDLVPSYATAIGSSADQPRALAELMGIIVNDGRRRPTVELKRVGFALGTPYHTLLEASPGETIQVMRPQVARLLRETLAEVVEQGTARRVNGAFTDEHGEPIRVGGKTGSGDNRVESYARSGQLVASRVASRTAGFVFYIGDRWFGVITASVPGPQASHYAFTSALPLAVLKLLSPAISEAVRRQDDARNQRLESLTRESVPFRGAESGSRAPRIVHERMQ